MTHAFSLQEDPAGKLILRRPELDDVADVRLRRAFPWSRANQFISLRTAAGKEILLIDDMAALPPEVRETAERWLARHSFIPNIRRIAHVDVSFGHQQWTVETDRGPVSFRVQEREDIRFLNDGRFSIKDADGNVYALAALRDLDVASRRAVEAVL